MKERIKKIRKHEELTQKEFAEKINLSQNFIAQIEMGNKIPSERTISDICREFKVNKDWLLTGDGEPFSERSRNQQILEFMNKTSSLPDGDFQKRFIAALAKLDVRDWEVIQKIIDGMGKEG